MLKILFALCLIAITAMFAFPPWETSINFRGINKKEHIGYHFVLSNPEPRLDGFEKEIKLATVSIEWERLLVQAIPVFLLFAVVLFRLKLARKKEKE
jgi:hypothetical protein